MVVGFPFHPSATIWPQTAQSDLRVWRSQLYSCPPYGSEWPSDDLEKSCALRTVGLEMPLQLEMALVELGDLLTFVSKFDPAVDFCGAGPWSRTNKP